MADDDDVEPSALALQTVMIGLGEATLASTDRGVLRRIETNTTSGHLLD